MGRRVPLRFSASHSKVTRVLKCPRRALYSRNTSLSGGGSSEGGSVAGIGLRSRQRSVVGLGEVRFEGMEMASRVEGWSEGTGWVYGGGELEGTGRV
jgi:hypothetical protein